jgi:ribosomal protein L23
MRMGRRKNWKKALVHLAEGQSLDVFEGVPEGEE